MDTANNSDESLKELEENNFKFLLLWLLNSVKYLAAVVVSDIILMKESQKFSFFRYLEFVYIS